MISSLNLAYMHLRLEELFGGHSWFGGENVIFVGDLLQLQPVNGSPVFEMISKKSLFPMKILFVQSTKYNSPMIVTDTIMHCIVCA